MIDQTAPEAAVTANTNGTVDITLPTNPVAGDAVKVTYTPTDANQATTATLTYNGSNWTGMPDGFALDGGKVTIAADKVADNTKVTVATSDVAGNTQPDVSATAKVPPITLQPWDLVITGESVANNNQIIDGVLYKTVLNQAEWATLQQSGKVRIILPTDGTVVEYDKVSVPYGVRAPYGSNEAKLVVQSTDLERGYVELGNANGFFQEITSGFNQNNIGGEHIVPVKHYDSTGTVVQSTHNYPIYIDITPPTAPDVQDGGTGDGTVTVTLPGDTDVKTTTITIPQADGSTQTVELVKNGDAWTVANGATLPQDVTLNGNTVTISGLADGTTVTAVATDAVGNTANDNASASNVNNGEPMALQSVTITTPDAVEATTDVHDINGSDLAYSFDWTGGVDYSKAVRVRIIDPATGEQVGDAQYFSGTQLNTHTVSGSFSGITVAKDDTNLQVVADLVNRSDLTPIADTAKTADFYLNNIRDVNVSGYTNTSVTVDGNTYNFGTPQADKSKPSADGTKVIYNPQLDWQMNYWDDAARYNNGGQYHGDHDSNVTYSANGVTYTWNGNNEKGDVIVASRSFTEDDELQEWTYFYRGVIGTRQNDKNDHSFVMDTKGGGADYIEAAGGITGKTTIRTNDGDDVIKTVYLNGKQDALGNVQYNFNGSQVIEMGTGDDQFLVTGKAGDLNITFYSLEGDQNAALFFTNSKIDMGADNDLVKITGGHITSARENDVGNYFTLGAGNDVMETKTISSEKDEYQGSNIINLGSGHDTLTVNGDIMGVENASYNGQEVRNYTDQHARFLLMSKDSSDVHITGNVGGKVTMLMGSGEDNIRIDQELWMNGNSNAMDWLAIALNRADISGNSNYYTNENGGNIRGDINTALAQGVSNSGATGLGATSLTANTNEGLQNDTGIADIAARIDLGNGNNTFSVGGGVTNANILGGADKDVIKLAFGAGANGQPNGNAWVYNTKVWTGEGDDLVMMTNVTGSAKVYSGAGSDDIQLYGVDGTNNEVHAGDGDDIIRLYGKVNGDSSNIFDGGDGYDTIIIGTPEDSASNGFTIGPVIGNHSQLWSIEEIQFGSSNTASRDWVKFTNNQRLNSSGELFIRNQDGQNVDVNQVDIKGTGWTTNGQTFSGHGDGITYKVYTNSANADAGTLYIQQEIQVLI